MSPVHGGPKKFIPLEDFSCFSASEEPIGLKFVLVMLQHVLHALSNFKILLSCNPFATVSRKVMFEIVCLRAVASRFALLRKF